MESATPSLAPKDIDKNDFHRPFDDPSVEKQFYENLEEADTLIDYFCLVGLDQVRLT